MNQNKNKEWNNPSLQHTKPWDKCLSDQALKSQQMIEFN